RLKNNPVTFPLYISLPGNRSLNFEDSGGGGLIGSTHLINKLAVETNSKEAAWYRNEFMKNGNDIFDIIWQRPELVAKPPKSSSIHFRTIDWWVMRSDFKDKTKVLVAGKAGMNDDPHHGHLDIGQFVVYWQGEYFIQDLGRAGYDEKYFDEARFDYPEASSVGHNVLYVNGEKQISGKHYKQPYDYDVGGEVIEFRTSDKQDYVIMDPTNAYPKKELKKWRRHVVLDKPVITIVVDEVQTNPGARIEVRFHPGVEFTIEDGFVLLNGKEGKMALIPFTDQDVDIVPGKHASQFVNATKDFHWLEYIDIEVTSTNEKTNIGTIILPVSGANEAQTIVDSKEI
ncbi:MAG: heparinase II/III-family protein, partial [Cyclobacteriaceae bacterium]|nr:heparinase II/III-family protein [Cyclobacteriaceae bacterium]